MIIYSLLFLLLSNAASLRRDKSILYSRQTIIILLYSSFLSLSNLNFTFFDTGVGIFGGLFHVTSITQVFHTFIFLVTAVILQLTSFYPRSVWKYDIKYLWDFDYGPRWEIKSFMITDILNKMGQQYKIIEYPLILLFVITGSVLLISSSDIVSIFLSIELQSYGLYLLSTIYRNSELSTSAGLTYFLLGGLSSCFILLGTSLLYANLGTTNLDGFYVITSLSNIANDYHNNAIDWYKPFYINISLIVISVGFLFKISAAPFHFWSPDVYDAIPTIVTAFVAIIAKISILIFFLDLVHYTSNTLFDFKFNWTSGILVSSLLSLIIGAVLGLTQIRIKRLLAYSTISHLGFILLALSINSIESIQAFIFYLMQYTISNLNAFMILITSGFSFYAFVNNDDNKQEYLNLEDRNNSPLQLISQIKGYFHVNHFLGLSLAITLFSFIGIPPLIGFFSKQMVLSAALDNGYVFLTLVAILTSVVSAVYYLGIIKQIYFDNNENKLDPEFEYTLDGYIISYNHNDEEYNTLVELKSNNIILSNCLTITISTLTLTLLLFIFTPQEWLSITNLLALLIFNP